MKAALFPLRLNELLGDLSYRRRQLGLGVFLSNILIYSEAGL